MGATAPPLRDGERLMFNAIIPLAQPIVAVQVDANAIAGPAGAELLARLEIHFMRPVVLVAWDEQSRCLKLGYPCPEEMLTDDDLDWRQFELPAEAEIPF
jgi:hypothetical protein